MRDSDKTLLYNTITQLGFLSVVGLQRKLFIHEPKPEVLQRHCSSSFNTTTKYFGCHVPFYAVTRSSGNPIIPIGFFYLTSLNGFFRNLFVATCVIYLKIKLENKLYNGSIKQLLKSCHLTSRSSNAKPPFSHEIMMLRNGE